MILLENKIIIYLTQKTNSKKKDNNKCNSRNSSSTFHTLHFIIIHVTFLTLQWLYILGTFSRHSSAIRTPFIAKCNKCRGNSHCIATRMCAVQTPNISPIHQASYVPLSLPVFSSTLMWHVLCKCISSQIIQKLMPLILGSVLLTIIQILITGFHLNTLQWTCDRRNNRESFLFLIPWYLPQIWHQWSSLNQIIWHKRRLPFCQY